jgi:hypothetical protein
MNDPLETPTPKGGSVMNESAGTPLTRQREEGLGTRVQGPQLVPQRTLPDFDADEIEYAPLDALGIAKAVLEYEVVSYTQKPIDGPHIYYYPNVTMLHLYLAGAPVLVGQYFVDQLVLAWPDCAGPVFG